MFSTRWRSLRICPLFPLLASDSPGSLARELTEFCVWLSAVYENNPVGLVSVWGRVAAVVDELSSGAVLLDNPDSYKIPLPSNLDNMVLDSVTTFCSRNSCPVTLLGIPKDKQNELLWLLLDTLSRDFHVCSSPENYLQRVPTEPGMETSPGPQKVILIRASNLGQCHSFFSNAGLQTVNLTVPGWVASTDNVKKICDKIDNLEGTGNKMFVFDLFCNSVFRYEQFDGSTSLPFKSGGKFHLDGKVVVSSPQQFKKIAD